MKILLEIVKKVILILGNGENMKTGEIFATLAIMFLPLMAVISVIFFVNNADYEIKEVKCYDKFSNELIGVNCEEKVYNSVFVEPLENTFPLFVLTSIIGFFGGLTLFIKGGKK